MKYLKRVSLGANKFIGRALGCGSNHGPYGVTMVKVLQQSRHLLLCLFIFFLSRHVSSPRTPQQNLAPAQKEKQQHKVTTPWSPMSEWNRAFAQHSIQTQTQRNDCYHVARALYEYPKAPRTTKGSKAVRPHFEHVTACQYKQLKAISMDANGRTFESCASD